ncbi:hypothetical protein BCR39DRAFT_529041 [Naematelia encephala]|uniref:U4/U6 snRNA-associated-splicing factor PRP24 n=1 Tax=Naematelia encephala TaxID=71784 RepID=A0A1Y2B6W4_9TREE|nr:hypothetical protein BCR39DRAFT_529041 [Naematelia encephala]
MEVEQDSKEAAPSDDATETALVELDEVLASLDQHPENVLLLKRQVLLLQTLGMSTAAIETFQRLTTLVMLNEDEWLKYLDLLISTSPQPLPVDSFLDVMEKFEQAERDYLCLDYRSHPPNQVESDLAEILVEDTVREMIRGVVIRGEGLLSESHLLWQLALDWEIGLLQLRDESSRDEQIERIHSLYIERLNIPHATIDQTLSSYSTFVGEWAPKQYEERLVNATESSQPAKFKYETEKRYGKHRADFEQEITYASDVITQGQIFGVYIGWETDLRAKTNGTTDPILARAVFERAISVYAKAAAAADVTRAAAVASLAVRTESGRKKSKKGKEHVDDDQRTAKEEDLRVAEESLKAYKDAEAGVWLRYQQWMKGNSTEQEASEVGSRAIRACPGSASLWIEFLSQLERTPDELDAAFERSLALGVFTAPRAPMANLVELFLYKAASDNRRYGVGDEGEGTHPVLNTCTRAFEEILTLDRAGDPSLKLEKFLLEWAETRAQHLLSQALEIVKQPNKSRSSSYQYVILLASVESRRGNVAQAGDIYSKAIQRSDLDWPEAVYEAFIRHENIHGTVANIQEVTLRIKKEEEKVLRRREKAAQEQSDQFQSFVQALPSQSSALPVDVAAEAVPVTEDTTHVTETVKPHGDDGPLLKRDRENTTVLVSGLSANVDVPQLEAFFSESGPIRETTVLPESSSALVEFQRVDSVPTALAKDRKKLQGHEIGITMLWRSNLYVTNFPQSMDDEGLRALFSQYGNILQTRWPSKKYNERRRFCYITMDSPRTAQEALVLDGLQMEGFRLSVRISNPTVKKTRTDASNNKLFVSGLKSSTKEQDVRELFEPYGTVVKVKLGWDEVKQACKGFAFVEMENEASAKASLTLDGSRFRNKRLQVQFPDLNIANKKSTDNGIAPDESRAATAEKRARSVRLHRLPNGTQEGILQQELEKLVPVKRLEVFEKKREAVAELESAADAGRLLMRPDGFVFNGASIVVTELGGVAPPLRQEATTEASTSTDNLVPRSSLSFAPRPPRRAIGKGRQAPAIDKSLPVTLSQPGGPARAQDDFRAMVAVKNQQRREVLVAKQSGATEIMSHPNDTSENGITANEGSVGSKRSAEGDEDHDVKRLKQDAP